MTPIQGRHKAPKNSILRKVLRLLAKFKRKLIFGSVGIFVMLVGYATLFVCIDVLRWSPSVAYAIQAVVSIELNFVLSYLITWRDRREDTMWGAFRRFHSVRLLLTVPLNQVLFNGLVRVGMNYLIANSLCITMAMVINYVLNDRFVFRNTKSERDSDVEAGKALIPVTDSEETMSIRIMARNKPNISVIIPTKQNNGSVARTVGALLTQKYDSPLEVIVVGDIGDSAWSHLEPFGNWIKRIAVDIKSPGRDSNQKRAIGLRHARAHSGILAVMDDDVVPESTWARDVTSVIGGAIHAAAGPVVGLGSSFWTRYIDKNPVASKTPRIGSEMLLNMYLLKREKFPVTANFAITRELYHAVGGPDPAFTNSYEDYSWMSLMIQKGYGIYCTPKLVCKRYHREGLRPLIREYRRSGKGCADLVATYKDCVFARRRVRQLWGFYTMMACSAAFAVFAPILVSTLTATAVLAILVAQSLAATKRVEGIIYPFISLLLGTMFIIGLTGRIIPKRALIAPVVRKQEFVTATPPHRTTTMSSVSAPAETV